MPQPCTGHIELISVVNILKTVLTVKDLNKIISHSSTVQCCRGRNSWARVIDQLRSIKSLSAAVTRRGLTAAAAAAAAAADDPPAAQPQAAP